MDLQNSGSIPLNHLSIAWPGGRAFLFQQKGGGSAETDNKTKKIC